MALGESLTKLQNLLHEIVRRTPVASEPERADLHEAVRSLDPDHRPAGDVPAGVDPSVHAEAARVASETAGPQSAMEAAQNIADQIAKGEEPA